MVGIAVFIEANKGKEKTMSDYDTELMKLKKENDKYLKIFEKDLKDQGLKARTIHNHISNVDVYINEYLTYYNLQEVPAGCYQIHDFLGDWFIRKTTWASCSNIKSTAASIKKFYKSMMVHGIVEVRDYDALSFVIKENMKNWLYSMKQYDDESELFF